MPLSQLIVAALILGRISGMIVSMPGLSMRMMPTMIRVIMIVCLTIILVPVVPKQEFAPTLHVLVTLSALEFMLGLLMGWLVNLVFSGVSMGMELISTQIGMAAAKQFNPSMSTSQSALGSLAILLAIGTFLGMDLHLQMIQILGNSFHQIPPGEVGDIVRGMSFWVDYSAVIVHYSMQIGAPIMGFVFLNNFFLAMLSRLAPSMNVFFSVGFLVSMIGGMILFALMLPMLFDYIIRICEDAIREIFVLLDVIGRR